MIHKKTLILLPGMDGTGLLFQPFLECLSDSIETQVITYPNDQSLSYDELVNFVKSNLPQSPFTLLAESFSGPIAYQLSFDKTLPIEKVIFAGSFITNPNPKLLSLSKFLPVKFLLGLSIPKLIIKHFCFGRYINNKLIELFLSTMKKVNKSMLANRIATFKNIEKPTMKIVQPCLNIIATEDRLLAKSVSAEISNYCAQVQTIKVEGPHFILQTQANILSDIIESFIIQNFRL